jgi:hypothetical protein
MFVQNLRQPDLYQEFEVQELHALSYLKLVVKISATEGVVPERSTRAPRAEPSASEFVEAGWRRIIRPQGLCRAVFDTRDWSGRDQLLGVREKAPLGDTQMGLGAAHVRAGRTIDQRVIVADSKNRY